ncbi:hypothetical protein MSG28_011709 [Choristoneura fumiferana]|uniref:Uncharacterized protein n=1 Tax=Choristoneura fumiferana TaxID=7141 RepID=A0ACC0KMV2_CHOFU|nr:hypothetical protein MSG28_011709 [Choristoneura fumiferana]
MDTVPDTTDVEEIVQTKKQTRFRKRQWEDNVKTNGETQEKREKPFEREPWCQNNRRRPTQGLIGSKVHK